MGSNPTSRSVMREVVKGLKTPDIFYSIRLFSAFHWLHGVTVSILPCHGRDTGSIPVGVAKACILSLNVGEIAVSPLMVL